jgi:transcriptional regulator with GAF, ATPase, and Fis domain
MAAAARELQGQDDPASTVNSAVALLVQNVEGCEAAGVSLVHGKRRVDTPAASAHVVVIGDQLQSELGNGPCLDAIWEEETVYVRDLATDPRWPDWGPRLVEATGVRSVLCIRLFTSADTLGALTMYASKVDGFSPQAKAEGLALAAHITMAVAAAQNIELLEASLDSRTVIAQACGMVMERFEIDSVRAFAVLTRLSSNQNAKLRDVAAQMVLSVKFRG